MERPDKVGNVLHALDADCDERESRGDEPAVPTIWTEGRSGKL